MRTRISRRQFARAAGGAFTSLALVGRNRDLSAGQSTDGRDGRLTVRPGGAVTSTLESGPLDIGDGRADGVIQMPSAPAPGPLPFLLFLHGATQSGATVLRRIAPAADAAGVVVVAPDSRGTSWDAIRGTFGEDVRFLNRTLEYVFRRVTIDPAGLTIGGFSDGASYALSLGLANGDLFPKVLACSPGFIIQAEAHGRPRLFFSHGTADQILPIDQCSRVMVPRLRTMRYDVTYREFDGRHELPPAIATEAMHWLTQT